MIKALLSSEKSVIMYVPVDESHLSSLFTRDKLEQHARGLYRLLLQQNEPQ